MGDCGNVCCVSVIVKDSVFVSLGVLKYVVCLCTVRGGMGFLFVLCHVELLEFVYFRYADIVCLCASCGSSQR